MQRRHVVILEPYHGGSHAAFIHALTAHGRHEYTVVSLPARKWKWRMRGAAAWFAREDNAWIGDRGERPVDLILANDMLAVTDLRALLPTDMQAVPIACYFHENQLSYPLPDESTRDYQYGMTNILSGLAADAVWFNSAYHLEAFAAPAETLLKKMPDFVPRGLVEIIRAKSRVLYPPVDVPARVEPIPPTGEAPVILWPHRWEYDKNPEPFFEALLRLHDAGVDFRLVMLGEQFRTAPEVFQQASARLAARIEHIGFLPSREDYLAALRRCDLVVSTAIQENFGMAVVEAILCGCQPLLPRRLAYPEVIPAAFHAECLYEDGELYGRLVDRLTGRVRMPAARLAMLREEVASRFGAVVAVQALEEAMDRLCVAGPTA